MRLYVVLLEIIYRFLVAILVLPVKEYNAYLLQVKVWLEH